jgi:hypothetical protein
MAFVPYIVIAFYFLFQAKKESSKEKLPSSEMKLTSEKPAVRFSHYRQRFGFSTVQTAFQLLPAGG